MVVEVLVVVVGLRGRRGGGRNKSRFADHAVGLADLEIGAADTRINLCEVDD